MIVRRGIPAGILAIAMLPLSLSAAPAAGSGQQLANPSQVGLSPKTVKFAAQQVWTTSQPQTVTVTNNGATVLNFISIVASGDYAQTNNCGVSLAPGSNCAITVTFSPSGKGNRAGYVTLSDTDSTNLQTVTLNGFGSVPASQVLVNPGVASLTPNESQQYQARGNGVGSSNVTWSVDGIAGGNTAVGTISTSGLYLAPASAGAHTITATNNQQPSQSGSAHLVVTNYAGTFSYHNDAGLTGQNLSENVLTTGNVNSSQFGKLFALHVDGYVYAEPLYVENVNIGGATHDVLYVATEHDSVYAFDADGRTKTALWRVSFINPPAVTTVPSTADNCTDLVPEIGITGTPAIDPVAGVLYAVVSTKESGQYFQRLHALDITTGAEEPGSPVTISASVPGTGAGSQGGMVSFDPVQEGQRPGLALVNGVVYLSWASHCDNDPYHGWVMGYDAQTLQQTAVFNANPNGTRDGIWMAGAPPAADADGSLYLMTGNGTFDASSGGLDYGDTFVKLDTSNGLGVADYFTPDNQATLSEEDADLGSGGNMLLPDQPPPYVHLLVGSGKEGSIYLVNRDDMGGYNPNNNNQIVQFLAYEIGGTWSMPAWWQNNVYFIGSYDVLKQFRLYNDLLSTSPLAQAPSGVAYPSATPVVSANGAAGGIVWMIDSSAYGSSGPAVMHAYDAANVSRELYNTSQNPARDQAGPATKFTLPTVANGRVYIGTQKQVDVYGLIP